MRLQRRWTRQLLDAQGKHRVLDLGCGPGHLTAEIASDVGADGRVLGLDRQASMLTAARVNSRHAGVAGNCSFVLADATALPIADGACDQAVAVQVLEYVPDVVRALAELHRVVAVGGRVVLIDTDWRSCVWAADDRERTDSVLALWEEHFVHPQLPTRLAQLARTAGFQTAEVHALPVVETDAQEDTYSLGMAATIERFVEGRHPGATAGWRDDIRSRAARGDYFFSLTRFAIVAER